MTLYHHLAAAKDNARRAKDHYETIRAIVESQIVTNGKNAEDRKRDLIVGLSNSDIHRDALDELRNAEHAVDEAQATIDQAEAERRDREWQIRARLAEALGNVQVANEDDVPDWLTDEQMRQRVYRQQPDTEWNLSGARDKAKREMDELFST